MRIALTVVLALLSLATHAPAQTTAPVYDQPLGIGLEGLKPPYPVQFLTLQIQGHTLRMAYMDVPPATPNGRAVLLLHGKNFFGDYWAGTIKALGAAGYRVIVPDQVGFGRSSKPTEIAYSFDLLAANTAALLDALKIDKVDVVGHSMGGMLAVRFVNNYPQRVGHLVIENMIGLEDYRLAGVPPTPLEKSFQGELNKTPESLRKYIRSYFVEWKPEYETLVEPHARVLLSGEYPRWAMSSALTYQMIYQQPVRQEFSRIAVPTLLVIGRSDRTAIGRDAVSPEIAAKLGNYPDLGRAAARDIPHAKLIELEKVGHIPHLEAADKFHEAMIEFLKE